MFLRDLMRRRRPIPASAYERRLQDRISELVREADLARECALGTTLGDVDRILQLEGRTVDVLSRLAVLMADWVRVGCPCALAEWSDYRLYRETGIER